MQAHEWEELPGVVDQLPVLARGRVPGVDEGGEVWQEGHAGLVLWCSHFCQETTRPVWT